MHAVKMFMELKTLEKDDVNHIVCIEGLTGDASRVSLSVGGGKERKTCRFPTSGTGQADSVVFSMWIYSGIGWNSISLQPLRKQMRL